MPRPDERTSAERSNQMRLIGSRGSKIERQMRAMLVRHGIRGFRSGTTPRWMAFPISDFQMSCRVHRQLLLARMPSARQSSKNKD